MILQDLDKIDEFHHNYEMMTHGETVAHDNAIAQEHQDKRGNVYDNMFKRSQADYYSGGSKYFFLNFSKNGFELCDILKTKHLLSTRRFNGHFSITIATKSLHFLICFLTSINCPIIQNISLLLRKKTGEADHRFIIFHSILIFCFKFLH